MNGDSEVKVRADLQSESLARRSLESILQDKEVIERSDQSLKKGLGEHSKMHSVESDIRMLLEELKVMPNRLETISILMELNL